MIVGFFKSAGTHFSLVWWNVQVLQTSEID